MSRDSRQTSCAGENTRTDEGHESQAPEDPLGASGISGEIGISSACLMGLGKTRTQWEVQRQRQSVRAMKPKCS